MSSYDQNLAKLRKLKIALVYDRVNTRYGGAEQVLLSLHELFPHAPLYTSVVAKKSAIWARDFTVIPSFLQKIPGAQNHHREFLPLMPLAFSSFDFSAFDIVISITSAEAKGIHTSGKTLHICYLLTPTRYLWSHHLEYETGKLSWAKKLAFNLLRYWDFKAGEKPDVIIPISRLVQQRTQKYYQRQTQDPIYPPFLANASGQTKLPSKIKNFVKNYPNYWLIVSRLVPYKNIELAIQMSKEKCIPLVIVGTGPEEDNVKKLIYQIPHILLLSKLDDYILSTIFENSFGLLLLAEEDFGITALEAQAHGKPVIVNSRSGAAETVIDTKTGLKLQDINLTTVSDALDQAKKQKWNTLVIKQNADQYNNVRFQQEFTKMVLEKWEERNK